MQNRLLHNFVRARRMKNFKKVSVSVKSLSLGYGSVEVLRDINLHVEPGEFFALIGPSGSGKTSLLRLIAGFHAHQKGVIQIDGIDISTQPPHLRNVGMVFQNYALWPHLTVGQNVAFGLHEQRLSKREVTYKVDAVLDLVGLGNFAQRSPTTLSGGQQQRVALARTIVVEPQVLLLDEPLSNLDAQLRTQMRNELKNLQRSLGLTTLFVTHDQEEAMATADKMAVLDGGLLQQTGTPTGLYDYPVNRFVARFIGMANMIDGVITQVTDETIRFKADGLETLDFSRTPHAVPKTGAVCMAIRPHQIALKVGDEQVDGSCVWLDGRIVSAEFSGRFSRYKVQVGGICLLADQPHQLGLTMFPLGFRVRLGLDPIQIRFLDA
ncbi:MAG: ABC transporter ATP-binding protein [Polaromonas sp.]